MTCGRFLTITLLDTLVANTRPATSRLGTRIFELEVGIFDSLYADSNYSCSNLLYHSRYELRPSLLHTWKHAVRYETTRAFHDWRDR